MISSEIKLLSKQFSAAGIENADFEAAELAAHVLDVDKATLLAMYTDELAEEKQVWLKALAERRISGEPLQYIIGKWDFYGLSMRCGEGVLIPRPESERLVDLAAGFVKKGQKIADLCAGSGCIGIATALKTAAHCTSIELSEKAFSYLNQNISANNAGGLVTAVLGDVLDEAADYGSFDGIFANPPYLSARDMAELQKEVSFEPEMALFGGETGFEFYERLIPLWEKRLKKGGIFAVEIGINMHEKISGIFADSGLSPQIFKDYNGIERIVYAVK